MMHRRLLIRGAQHETAQIRRSVCCALRLVSIDPIVPGYDHPDARIAAEHPDPFDIGTIAADWKVADVEGSVTLVLDEAVQGRREDG